MLVSLSLLLTRAKRKRQPVAVLRVASFEQVEAVLAASAAEEVPVVLHWTYDADAWSHGLLRAITERIATHTQQVALVCETAGHHMAVQSAIVAGAFAVQPNIAGLTEAEAIGLLSWSCDVAGAAGAEVVLSLAGYEGSWHPLAAARHDVMPVSAVYAPVLTEHNQVSKAAVQALLRKFAVPVVALSAAYSQSQRHHLQQLRVAGFYAESDVDEAYIAGLRTALRDREITRSERVAAYAYQSVVSTVRNLISTL